MIRILALASVLLLMSDPRCEAGVLKPGKAASLLQERADQFEVAVIKIGTNEIAAARRALEPYVIIGNRLTQLEYLPLTGQGRQYFSEAEYLSGTITLRLRRPGRILIEDVTVLRPPNDDLSHVRFTWTSQEIPPEFLEVMSLRKQEAYFSPDLITWKLEPEKAVPPVADPHLGYQPADESRIPIVRRKGHQDGPPRRRH